MRTLSYIFSLLLVFLIPIEGLFRLPGAAATLVRLVGIGVGLFWLLAVIVTGRLRRPSPLQLALGLFVFWNAMSIFWSANPVRTGNHALTWLQLLGMSLMFWDLYTSRAAILNALQMYVLGAYVAIGSAVVNYLSGQSYYTNYQRYAAGDTNPDGFGFILAMGIPIAFYLASAQDIVIASRLRRILNYSYIPAAFIGLALSGTRTALLASLVGLAFGLISITRVRLWVRLLILGLLVSSLLYLVPYVQTLKSFQRLGTITSELTEGDLNNRTNNWREGLEAFEENPILGVGGNMYRTVNSWGKVAHNTYLSVLVELGVVGFLIFAFMLAIGVTEAWRHKSILERLFWLALMLVWSTGAFTLTWEHRKTTWLFLSLIVASAAVSRAKAHRAVRFDESSSVPEPARLANTEGLAADPAGLSGRGS